MTAAGHAAWIGLGSNLDDPSGRLDRAVAALRSAAGIRVLACSRYYRTAPVGGPAGQPAFCNAAVAVATNRSPLALLADLQAIEDGQERRRDVRWGPRTLDLDLLAYDAVRMAGPELVLPHPRAAERAFVLVPLADIAPALTLGAAGRVVDCLARVDTGGVAPWSAS